MSDTIDRERDQVAHLAPETLKAPTIEVSKGEMIDGRPWQPLFENSRYCEPDVVAHPSTR
jgi:hypothetical protein